MKKYLWIVFVVFVIVAGIVYYRRSGAGNQYLPKNFSDLRCIESVAVSGQSMEPAVKAGSQLTLNKCISDKENISIGTIVLASERGTKRLGRIKEKLILADGIWYKISQDNRPDQEFTVSTNDVIAVQ